MKVTSKNLEDLRHELPRDQAAELAVGCETWPVYYEGGQRGQLTVWPNGRAALCLGGDSTWGEWDGEAKQLLADSGERYDEEGNLQPSGD